MPLPKAPAKPGSLLDLSTATLARGTRQRQGSRAQPQIDSGGVDALAAGVPAASNDATRGSILAAVNAPLPSLVAGADGGIEGAVSATPAPIAPTAMALSAASPVAAPASMATPAPLPSATGPVAVPSARAPSADGGDTGDNSRRQRKRNNDALKVVPRSVRPERAASKLFVLDTNVLMHDPTALTRFAEHDVYLPMMTLEELDNHKRGMTDVARNARQVSRTLEELIAKSPDADIDAGLELSTLGNKGNTGRLYFQTQAIAAMLPSSLPVGKADNQILGVVRALQDRNPGRETVLVSKDINMRIKARALGLPAEDYFNDQVLEDTDLLYPGVVALPANFWDKHGKGVESWQQGGSTFYRLTGPMVPSFLLNEFVYLDGDMPLVAQVKQLNGNTAVLQTLRDHAHHKNAVWGITARNREQNFALNLLMNPEIDFVSLLGQAGTGKTLLTLAAGLAQTIEGKRFTEIIMTRATVPVGDDIGYLPGTEEEKMQPWMGALEDNLEVLNQGDPAAGEWGRQATNDIIRSRVKVKSLSFMRGRTFINKFLIIDEAQNLTPKQMKTLVTRAGPGTKVVCLGNIAQIDTPYLTEGSSGLTYVVDRFKGWVHAGHITLQRGERSRLADFAAEAL